MPAWSNLVNFWSNFDPKSQKMFRARDVCGNVGLGLGFLEFQATKVRFDCVYHQMGAFWNSVAPVAPVVPEMTYPSAAQTLPSTRPEPR